MHSRSDLYARLLVGRHDEVTISERLALPETLVEFKDSLCFLGERRIPGKNPAAVSPGADSIRGQPPPHRGDSDRGDQTALDGFPAYFGDAQPRQRQTVFVGKLTGQSLDRDDHAVISDN